MQARALFHHAAQGRHRLGQDRGLSRGGRRGAAPRPPGAGDAARDRADGRVPRPGRGALRRPPRRVAFRRHLAEPPPRLGRRRPRRGGAGRRRPLGAVPAVRRPGPDRGRRGARRLLQAGGRRALPRPRHGRAARLDRGGGGRARLGHPEPRDLGQRARPANTPASTCPSGSASPRCPRWPRSTCAARASPRAPGSRPRSPPRSASASPRASSRSCSSTAAAMRRSRSAAPAATRSAASTATRAWSSIACAAAWSATSAAPPARSPTACPSCGRRGADARARPRASSGWPRRRRGSGPRRASPILSSDLADSHAVAQGADRPDRAGRGRHRHRHADRLQGPQLPAPDAGRGDRRRPRAAGRRPARGREDVPADPPGRRPGRARRAAPAGRWSRPTSPSIR